MKFCSAAYPEDGKNPNTCLKAILKHLIQTKMRHSIVLSLIGSRQVQLQELAVVFNHEVKEESKERRLQSFFKDCN
jgi:prephenate dehydratase